MLISMWVELGLGIGLHVVPWTNIKVQAEQTFGQLFMDLQAGVFDCVPVTGEMKEVTLHLTYVGKKIEQLGRSK